MNTPVRSTPTFTIGIMDSGIGGLSVTDAVYDRIPNARIYYYCDNQNFPYGPKTPGQVNDIVEKAYHRWAAQLSLDILIIACNTASTVVLPRLRQLCKVPVVGVVPAIKPAALLSKTGKVALLATPGTVASKYTQDLIDQFAVDKQVLRLGNGRLVEIAEEKLRGVPVRADELTTILAPLFEDKTQKVDQIILGCTHFPLLVEDMKNVVPWPVGFVDSSGAVANRVLHLLKLDSQDEGEAMLEEFCFSADTSNARRLEPVLRERGFQRFRYGLL